MLTVEDARIQSASFARRDQAIDTIVLQYTELDLKSSLRIVRYGEDSILKKLDAGCVRGITFVRTLELAKGKK